MAELRDNTHGIGRKCNAFCPVCDKFQDCDLTLVSVKNFNANFRIVFCNVCNTAMRYPTLTSDKIKEYYSSGYNLSNYQDDLEVTFQVMKQVSEYRFSYITSAYGGIPQRYLEIGPGSGTLISMFQDNGSETIGVEPDENAAVWMRTEKNLNIYNGFFEGFVNSEEYNRYKNRYNVVTMSHVLEHIPKPVHFLHQAKDLLSIETGVLFIEVPNVLNPFSDKKGWQYYCDPGHIYYYSPTSLKYVLEKAGYKIVSMTIDEYPPYFPIFCIARPDVRASDPRIELKQKDDIMQIRKIWLLFRLKHSLYYYPLHLLKQSLYSCFPSLKRLKRAK